MGRLMVAWWLGVGMLAAVPGEPALHRFEFAQVEMAIPVKITLYAKNQEAASLAAAAAFSRFHALNRVMSDYDPESELNRLCDTAGQGKAVKVSDDLWKVLAHAEKVSAQSEGAFDVTVGPVVRLWQGLGDARNCPGRSRLPPPALWWGISSSASIPPATASSCSRLTCRLDLGGIAKGYAVDEALAVLRNQGIARALVDAGGDLGLGDPPPDRPGWRIGLTPLDGTKAVKYLVLSRVAVSTSGDNVQFVELGGRRYSHVVDPRSGMALTDHCRVTIVMPNGMAADALCKVVAILGPERGLKLIEATPGAAALILRAPQGKVEQYQSSRWKDLPTISGESPAGKYPLSRRERGRG